MYQKVMKPKQKVPKMVPKWDTLGSQVEPHTQMLKNGTKKYQKVLINFQKVPRSMKKKYRERQRVYKRNNKKGCKRY